MRVPAWMVRRLASWAQRLAASRPPDWVIGEDYLDRWWVIPRNRVFNIYLHHFMRSDNDVLHDHPWWNVSCLIAGRYIEHTIAAGGVHHRREYRAGDIKARRATAAHRVELYPGESTWSLFLTGPKVRDWYFHCKQRLVHWRDFTAPTADGNTLGRGCGEYQ